MDKAIISLSFDDARQDNDHVFNTLFASENIPATLNVTTAYVDKTITDDRRPSTKAAMSVDEVKKVASSPLFEVALHGDFHTNTPEDIKSGDVKLKSWTGIPENEKLGFASPGSGMPIPEFIHSENDFLKNGILYMRTDLKLERFVKLRVFLRKVSRVIPLSAFYKFAFADTVMHDCKDRIIYSVPILKNTTFSQVRSIIDLCIKRKGALTLTFHSITENTENEDKWSWSLSNLKKLCDYLKEKQSGGKLEILTTKDLYNRLKP